MDAADLRASCKRAADLGRVWSIVEVSERLVARAITVLNIHDLRTGDALQLAAALIASGDNPTRLPFVALDKLLLGAAEREGFAVIEP